MSRASRLLSLLQALRGRGRPVTARELAADLEVSARTIYRDVADLVARGAPIRGEAGFGYVLEPGLFLPPLMLDVEEAEAVVLGLRYVAQRGDPTLERAADSALAKIADILPPAAGGAVREPVSLPGPPGWGFPPNTVDLADLRAAIRAQARLRLTYTDAAGANSERVVWPLAIGFMNEARVLVAWCELRTAFRHFRTDRVTAATPEGGRYPGRRADLLRRYHAHMNLDEKGRVAADTD